MGVYEHVQHRETRASKSVEGGSMGEMGEGEE